MKLFIAYIPWRLQSWFLLCFLQKPSSRSKARDDSLHLECCLKRWLDGKLNDLMHEGSTIQRQLTRSQQSQKNDDRTARLFAKLMMEGKVHAALQLVTQANACGPLPRKQKSAKNGEGLGTPIMWLTSGGRKVDIWGEGHNHRYVCAHALENGTQRSNNQSVSRAEFFCVSSSTRMSGVPFEPAEE